MGIWLQYTYYYNIYYVSIIIVYLYRYDKRQFSRIQYYKMNLIKFNSS